MFNEKDENVSTENLTDKSSADIVVDLVEKVSKERGMQALPTPSELFSGAPVITTQEIRGEIRTTLRNDIVWDQVVEVLEPQGTQGSVQFDHAFVAGVILDSSEKLQGINGLSKFVLWQHIHAVLRAQPFFYILDRGYIIGRDDKAAGEYASRQARRLGKSNIA